MVRPSPPYASGMDMPKRPSSRISAMIAGGTVSVSATPASAGCEALAHEALDGVEELTQGLRIERHGGSSSLFNVQRV